MSVKKISFIPLFLLVCCVISLSAQAQKKEFTLIGVVYKMSAANRISKVLVANLTNNAITMTDDLGSFKISSSIGDTILFRQKDYADKKVAVITENALMVYLESNINLSEINVKDITKKQELNQLMHDYNKKGVYYNGKPPVMSAIMSPLNGLYSLFGSDAKQARRFNKYSARELEQTEIDRRFTRKLVMQVTGLTDNKKVDMFMDSYKPSYEDIKKWNDYDLIAYIKKSFKYFEENGPKPDLPKLF